MARCLFTPDAGNSAAKLSLNFESNKASKKRLETSRNSYNKTV